MKIIIIKRYKSKKGSLLSVVPVVAGSRQRWPTSGVETQLLARRRRLKLFVAAAGTLGTERSGSRTEVPHDFRTTPAVADCLRLDLELKHLQIHTAN